MNLLIDNHLITLIDDPAYSKHSTDNKHLYTTELCRNNELHYSSAHGVFAEDSATSATSVVLLGIGGATAIHKHSLAHNDKLCFIASGDAVFALKVPSLELKWCKQVDRSTCFGLFWIEPENCLITWGEQEVCRYSSKGEKIWAASGADIFETCECHEKYIKLTDFDDRKYCVNIKTGRIQRLETK